MFLVAIPIFNVKLPLSVVLHELLSDCALKVSVEEFVCAWLFRFVFELFGAAVWVFWVVADCGTDV
jgi:hypothetical protein